MDIETTKKEIEAKKLVEILAEILYLLRKYDKNLYEIERRKGNVA